MAIQLREIAESHLEKIYQTIQERLQTESDNIIKIEQQLETDTIARQSLQQRITEVCEQLNKLFIH